MARHSRVYCVAQSKGGVGKSTLTFNLGGILADMGQRVLLIDTDDQKTLTKLIELPDSSSMGLVEFITHDLDDLKVCVSPTQIPNMDVVYHNDTTALLSDYCRKSASNLWRLKSVLSKISGDYDFVIIDTSGKIGHSDLQEMAIRGSDLIIAPVVPDILNTADFLTNTVEMVERLEPQVGTGVPPPPPMLCVLNRKRRTNIANELEQGFRQEFYQSSGGKITFAQTVIPELKCYSDIGNDLIPVHRLETSRSSSTPPALAVMLKLVYELAPHLVDVLPKWPGANSAHFPKAQAHATSFVSNQSAQLEPMV